jgi:hypothetical protein
MDASPLVQEFVDIKICWQPREWNAEAAHVPARRSTADQQLVLGELPGRGRPREGEGPGAAIARYEGRLELTWTNKNLRLPS